MATIGNMAMIQYRMADVQARYSTQLANIRNNQNSYNINKSPSDYDEFWDNILKDKAAYIKQEYEKLYNSVFGIKGESAEKEVSLKQASGDVMGSAEDISRFANSLEYGGEYDAEQAEKFLDKFVGDYNTFIDKVGDSDSNAVLEKGVVMVNTAKVYTSALRRVGIEVGSDNKLAFGKEKLPNVSATDIKSTFGDMGFSEKTLQKAEQINRLAGSTGLFSYTNASTGAYSYNIGALFSTYA